MSSYTLDDPVRFRRIGVIEVRQSYAIAIIYSDEEFIAVAPERTGHSYPASLRSPSSSPLQHHSVGVENR